MARSNMKPEVFVSMDSEGGTRSIFNGVQTYDGKGDINNPATWKTTNKGNPYSRDHISKDMHKERTCFLWQVWDKYSIRPNSQFSCAIPTPKRSPHTTRTLKGITNSLRSGTPVGPHLM